MRKLERTSTHKHGVLTYENTHTHARTHVFSYADTVCINKSKLYMGIEAKCHGNI